MLPWRHMVYSGPIDAFFGRRHGSLPHRSLDFELVTLQPPVPGALRRYEADTAQCPHVNFVGRLASYKFYNRDQVVGQALATQSGWRERWRCRWRRGVRRPDPEVKAGLGVSTAGLESRNAAPIPMAKPPVSPLTVSTKTVPRTPLLSRSHRDA